MRPLIHLLFSAGLTLLLAGCAAPEKDGPVSLKIAVNDIYCTQTACFCVHDVAARDYAEILEKLHRNFGIDLQLDYFIEPYQLEEAVLTGKYDGVLSKPWFVLRLQKQNGADYLRVADILDPNNNRWLAGIVIVPTNSPIRTLDELNGKHVFIGETDAYEKHFAAKRLFQEKGIKPAAIETKASCSENIGVLLDGKADAAVISDYALSADCAVDFAKPGDFRILAHTEKIPLTSLMIDRNRIDPQTVAKLKDALNRLSGKAAGADLLGNGFVEPAPWNPPELEAP